MSTQKSILSRIIAACSRKPKQAFIPSLFAKINVPTCADPLPEPVDKPPHKPCFYIPTEESPWAVIVFVGGKWRFDSMRPTRDAARNLRDYYREQGQPARVVRALIPTR